jgi:hypothetical protein
MAEENAQVSAMGRIFSAAHKVYTDESDRVVDLSEDFHSSLIMQLSDMISCQQLCARPYWQRSWIIQ